MRLRWKVTDIYTPFPDLQIGDHLEIRANGIWVVETSAYWCESPINIALDLENVHKPNPIDTPRVPYQIKDDTIKTLTCDLIGVGSSTVWTATVDEGTGGDPGS